MKKLQQLNNNIKRSQCSYAGRNKRVKVSKRAMRQLNQKLSQWLIKAYECNQKSSDKNFFDFQKITNQTQEKLNKVVQILRSYERQSCIQSLGNNLYSFYAINPGNVKKLVNKYLKSQGLPTVVFDKFKQEQKYEQVKVNNINQYPDKIHSTFLVNNDQLYKNRRSEIRKGLTQMKLFFDYHYQNDQLKFRQLKQSKLNELRDSSKQFKNCIQFTIYDSVKIVAVESYKKQVLDQFMSEVSSIHQIYFIDLKFYIKSDRLHLLSKIIEWSDQIFRIYPQKKQYLERVRQFQSANADRGQNQYILRTQGRDRLRDSIKMIQSDLNNFYKSCQVFVDCRQFELLKKIKFIEERVAMCNDFIRVVYSCAQISTQEQGHCIQIYGFDSKFIQSLVNQILKQTSSYKDNYQTFQLKENYHTRNYQNIQLDPKFLQNIEEQFKVLVTNLTNLQSLATSKTAEFKFYGQSNNTILAKSQMIKILDKRRCQNFKEQLDFTSKFDMQSFNFMMETFFGKNNLSCQQLKIKKTENQQDLKIIFYSFDQVDLKLEQKRHLIFKKIKAGLPKNLFKEIIEFPREVCSQILSNRKYQNLKAINSNVFHISQVDQGIMIQSYIQSEIKKKKKQLSDLIKFDIKYRVNDVLYDSYDQGQRDLIKFYLRNLQKIIENGQIDYEYNNSLWNKSIHPVDDGKYIFLTNYCNYQSLKKQFNQFINQYQCQEIALSKADLAILKIKMDGNQSVLEKLKYKLKFQWEIKQNSIVIMSDKKRKLSAELFQAQLDGIKKNKLLILQMDQLSHQFKSVVKIPQQNEVIFYENLNSVIINEKIDAKDGAEKHKKYSMIIYEQSYFTFIFMKKQDQTQFDILEIMIKQDKISYIESFVSRYLGNLEENVKYFLKIDPKYKDGYRVVIVIQEKFAQGLYKAIQQFNKQKFLCYTLLPKIHFQIFRQCFKKRREFKDILQKAIYYEYKNLQSIGRDNKVGRLNIVSNEPRQFYNLIVFECSKQKYKKQCSEFIKELNRLIDQQFLQKEFDQVQEDQTLYNNPQFYWIKLFQKNEQALPFTDKYKQIQKESSIRDTAQLISKQMVENFKLLRDKAKYFPSDWQVIGQIRDNINTKIVRVDHSGKEYQQIVQKIKRKPRRLFRIQDLQHFKKFNSMQLQRGEQINSDIVETCLIYQNDRALEFLFNKMGNKKIINSFREIIDFGQQINEKNVLFLCEEYIDQYAKNIYKRPQEQQKQKQKQLKQKQKQLKEQKQQMQQNQQKQQKQQEQQKQQKNQDQQKQQEQQKQQKNQDQQKQQKQQKQQRLSLKPNTNSKFVLLCKLRIFNSIEKENGLVNFKDDIVTFQDVNSHSSIIGNFQGFRAMKVFCSQQIYPSYLIQL